MARIIALDYGKKRTGIAATDPMQLIVSPLGTVATDQLMDYLHTYLRAEAVDALVLGHAPHADGSETPLEADIQAFITDFSRQYPAVVIHRHDEHHTSQRAAEVIRLSGTKKNKRKDKALVDKISAAIILQEFMGFI